MNLHSGNPLISIIIRTCPGRKGCLEKAVESVMQQTYRPIEVVVVEDGGNQATEVINELTELHDIQVTYKPLDKVGRCIAGNIGMEAASGEYLCFLDDDDELYANHCEVLAAKLGEDDQLYAACGLADEIITSISSYTPFVYKEYEKYVRFKQVFSRESLWMGNYLPIQSVLFKKSLYLENGGFDSNFEVLEDWDLWVRFSCNHKFVSLPEVTSMYRVPFESDKRKSRESSFRENYFDVVSKQRDLRTSVDKGSYMTIVRALLSRYRILDLLNKMSIINFEKICRVEEEDFPAVQEKLLDISPRDAVIKAHQRLARNKIYKFSTVFENRVKTKINYILGLFN